MDMRKVAVVAGWVAASIAMSADVHAQAAAGGKTLASSEIKWSDNPALPPGVKSVVLMGDPAQGPYVIRVRLSADAKIMPHSHATENQVTVLSGTLLYGEGDKFDPRRLKPYKAGSFIVEKAKAPHFMTAKGPTVFQVSVPGKATFDYVDPKDDPRKK